MKRQFNPETKYVTVYYCNYRADDQILADLLTHEAKSKDSRGQAATGERSEYSGSESDEEMEDVGSSEDEEEQFLVKVMITYDTLLYFVERYLQYSHRVLTSCIITVNMQGINHIKGYSMHI